MVDLLRKSNGFSKDQAPKTSKNKSQSASTEMTKTTGECCKRVNQVRVQEEQHLAMEHLHLAPGQLRQALENLHLVLLEPIPKQQRLLLQQTLGVQLQRVLLNLPILQPQQLVQHRQRTCQTAG